MKRKYFIPVLFILTIGCINILSAKDTLITVTPYSFGKITINRIISYNWKDINNGDKWSKDTISFSCGTKITFVNLDNYLIGGLVFTGGIVFLDSTSLVFYKFNESLEKKYYLSYLQLYPASYSITTGNPDIDWNSANTFPNSVATCDSLIINYGIDTLPVKGKAIYSQGVSFQSECEGTLMLEIFNSIMYVKNQDDIHLKLQISNISLHKKYIGLEEDTAIILDSLQLLWAVDSMGNGIFKHDPVKTNDFNEVKKEISFGNIANILTVNGNPCLYMSDNFLNCKKKFQIDIFDLKGKRLLQKRNVDFLTLNFSSGVYFIHIASGKDKYFTKFIIP